MWMFYLSVFSVTIKKFPSPLHISPFLFMQYLSPVFYLLVDFSFAKMCIY